MLIGITGMEISGGRRRKSSTLKQLTAVKGETEIGKFIVAFPFLFSFSFCTSTNEREFTLGS
jgi:hypothetical protein